MEQRDILDELLTLRQEVQSLKFINGGGAISDLVSRVSALEAQPKCVPNFNKTLWSMSLGRDTNPRVEIFPEWTSRDTSIKQFATVPQDGILLMQVYVVSLVKEQHDDISPENGNSTESTTIRISTGTIASPKYLVTSEVLVKETNDVRSSFATQAVPVAAGTPLFFNACLNPNHGNNKVLIHLYDFMQ